ncbi:MAG: COX15/CtaA family protein [Pseudomonadota bacterium]
MVAIDASTLSFEDNLSRVSRDEELRNRTHVRSWLYFSSLVLLILVVVGGATRLTDSGLSITQWEPIHGVIPPLTEAQWQAELAEYRLIPEYQLQNRGMSMAEFQFIYWWEWGHRFLARFLGLVVLIPMVFFLARRRIDPRMRPQTVGIFLLICFQGFVGWWMVSSGLTERVDVSHYRLATHLSMAAIILALMVWTARGLAPHAEDLKPTAWSHYAAAAVAGLALVQIWMGAMVAGMDAGLVFNEWPLMDGSFAPPADLVWLTTLGWQNWVENPAYVQFAHRIGAYVVLAVTALHCLACWRFAPGSTHARRATVLLGLMTAQAVVGIVTLVMAVPLNWALVHQGLAFVIFAFAIAHWRAMVGPLKLLNGSTHSHAAEIRLSPVATRQA